MNRPSTETFRRQLPDWDRYFTDFSGVALLPMWQRADALHHPVRNIRRRLREGPQAPIRVAFFGATGAGKSKLFSSVLGKPLSSSGYRRPFTRQPCFYLHDDWRALQETLDGEVHRHSDAAWSRWILIDTPDFDSVEQQNRAEAERIFAEADAFVFVTDSMKYADASTWSYLTAIHRSQKELILVLNKILSTSVVESFLERYRGTLLRDEVDAVLPIPIVIPEFRLADDELIDRREPSLQQLERAIRSLELDTGPTARDRLLRLEISTLMQRAAEFQQAVHEKQGQVRELNALLAQRLQEAHDRLDQRLAVTLDSSVRDEVFQRVLTRIENLDVLRYPRRLLSMPVRAARALLTCWWPRSPSTEPPIRDNPADSQIGTESFQMLEAEVLQLTNQLRIDISGQPGFEPLLTRERFRQLRPDHDTLKKEFRQQNDRFQSWVADHAKETASQITTENKAKFFLSQLLFNSVLITAQVHSGGLSLMELGLDGVVSPMMAKGIGMLIGNEKVQQFERAAREEHRQLLSAILASIVQRFREFLDDAAAGLDELQTTLDSILQFEFCTEDLVQEFRAPQPAGPDSLGTTPCPEVPP